MAINIKSEEYEAWHELGHAVTCIELGGTVAFVEFIANSNHFAAARTSCASAPEYRKHSLCGGFAAEYTLNKHGLLEKVDPEILQQTLMYNSKLDKSKYFDVPDDHEFSEEQTSEFNSFAITNVVPIVEKYLDRITTMAKILVEARRIDGDVIQTIMNIPASEFEPYV